MTFDQALKRADRIACILFRAVIAFVILALSPLYFNIGRYAFVGATPRGVIVFDTFTGDAGVRAPIFPPTTSTTLPEPAPAPDPEV